MRTFRTERAVVGRDYTLEAVAPNVLRFDIIRTNEDNSHVCQAVTVDMTDKTERQFLDEAVDNSFAAILACWGWDEQLR